MMLIRNQVGEDNCQPSVGILALFAEPIGLSIP